MDKEKKDKADSPYLAGDIEEIIVETDEKDPIVIARIKDVLKPSSGYRVRVSFKGN